MSKELTFSEVSGHKTKRDLFLIIHDKVYDASKFIDEHPGGEEVLVDVGGQDATEAFEDVGHSDEAREMLEDLLVGTLKRMPGDPVAKATSPAYPQATGVAQSSGLGINLYAALLLGGAAAYFGYQYLLV